MSWSLASIPKATITLFSANILFFFFASGSFFTSPSYADILRFGLSSIRPLSIFTYQFFHLWPSHLLTNLFLLLIFGSLVEEKVGPIKLFALYFTGGILGGIAHLLFSSSAIVSGASASVWSIVGAAILLRPVLSAFAFIASIFIIPFAIHPAVAHVQESLKEATEFEVETAFFEKESVEKELQSEQKRLREISLNRTLHEDELAKKIKVEEELFEKKESGEITEAEFEKLKTEIEAEKRETEEKISVLKEEKEKSQKELAKKGELLLEISSIAESAREKLNEFYFSFHLEESTPSTDVAHIAGLLNGYLLIFLAEPGAFDQWETYFTYLRK